MALSDNPYSIVDGLDILQQVEMGENEQKWLKIICVVVLVLPSPIWLLVLAQGVCIQHYMVFSTIWYL